MRDVTIWRATVDSKRKMKCVECEEDGQCIAIQTPIAVKVYFPSRHPAFRKSLGSNVEARCERCGKIHVYDINHWEIYGEPVQSSTPKVNNYICPKCGGSLNIGMCHRLDPGWEGFYCSSCGYFDPPLKVQGSASTANNKNYAEIDKTENEIV